MKSNLIMFASVIVCMVAIDATWLGLMVRRFYQPRIGHLMAESPQLQVAAVFYIVYAAGLCALVLNPALERGLSPGHAALLGAVYGLVTYGTYDLTNHATLKGWPASLTVVDMAWGGTMTAVVSLVTMKLCKWGFSQS